MNKKVHGSITKFMITMLALIFILFYPMLISIYVFLPLLIGIMGYALLRGIEKGNFFYIMISTLYFINLEVNLSLPYFLTIISTLLVYVLIYPYFTHFKRCNICRPILSVLFLDGVYLGSLLFYDFIFQSHSIVLDNLLLYSLIVDLLVVVIL
jgi:hypothetical protein